ncbi:calcium:proton antiporter [Rhizobium sp. LjRoot254]|uniref:calcium:proton antiporter n=1 Tax=Rhizobium sp. LjRoot254 TaxID=3342297 RepID=UPI003F4F430E
MALFAGLAILSSEDKLLAGGSGAAFVIFAILLVAIVTVSVRVARHAEALAQRIGDPYGTMILTLSAVLIEVVILAIIMSSESSPTLVRDTIYAAVMLDINGIIGLSALIGGLKHGEQPYNDDSGRTYSVMIMTAMGLSMMVPEFVPQARLHLYSIFTIFAMLTLYALFVRMQVGRHSGFFRYSYALAKQQADSDGKRPPPPLVFSIAMIVVGIAIIGFLAEVMSTFLNAGIRATGISPALVAVVVAAISAAPEILTALRAALKNRMQAVINIAMGASLSTVILTVPAMEALAMYTGQPLLMAMTPLQTVMVALTLIVAAINLNDGETNAIEGMTHFVLFGAFVMLTILAT